MPHARDPLLVTARLASSLAGEPPRLDAVLEYALSLHHAKAVPGHKITRDGFCPAMDAIPVPLRREWLGPWYCARCSDAIVAEPTWDGVEHVAKRIAVEHAGLLAPRERLVVNTTNSWTKSYRLPLRVRRVDRVAWFCVGDRREILVLLRRVGAIGKKIADGYGRVREWTVERVAADLSWFAPSDVGPVLMGTLPLGDWLPADLVGAKRDFRAVAPPYWHVSRRTECVVPC